MTRLEVSKSIHKWYLAHIWGKGGLGGWGVGGGYIGMEVYSGTPLRRIKQLDMVGFCCCCCFGVFFCFVFLLRLFQHKV